MIRVTVWGWGWVRASAGSSRDWSWLPQALTSLCRSMDGWEKVTRSETHRTSEPISSSERSEGRLLSAASASLICAFCITSRSYSMRGMAASTHTLLHTADSALIDVSPLSLSPKLSSPSTMRTTRPHREERAASFASAVRLPLTCLPSGELAAELGLEWSLSGSCEQLDKSEICEELECVSSRLHFLEGEERSSPLPGETKRECRLTRPSRTM